jgi:3-methylfumaryl-CoA hydratase
LARGIVTVPECHHTDLTFDKKFPAMILQQTDCAAADVAARLAACLDVEAGPTLPPLWHWALFLDPVPAADLGTDGHRAHGALAHHDPDLTARLWAGGSVTFHRPIPLGTMLRRCSRLADTSLREGRSGRLRFVTLRHDILSGPDLLIEERQDLVYRAPNAPRAAAAPAPPAPPGAARRTVTPDEILLFRFSALTFNAHRIHYDLPYATQVEHYPGLVVHGPLQAILLAGHLGATLEGAVIRQFDYRGVSPAYAGQPLQLEAWPDAERPDRWQLRTRSPSGLVCMSAAAVVSKEGVLF